MGLIKPTFYINGPETLPAPLKTEEETKLLSKSDKKSRDTLIVHNLRLVVYIARKFDTVNASIEDLISIGTIGLIKAVNTFCPERNIKLATYASRCIENEILMYLRKTQKIRQEVSLDEVLSIDSEGNEMMLSDVLYSTEPLALEKITKEEDVNNIYYALSRLKEREREIMVLRFGLNGKKPLTQKEVADLLGISQSYISRLEKRIIDKMRNIITSKVNVA